MKRGRAPRGGEVRTEEEAIEQEEGREAGTPGRSAWHNEASFIWVFQLAHFVMGAVGDEAQESGSDVRRGGLAIGFGAPWGQGEDSTRLWMVSSRGSFRRSLYIGSLWKSSLCRFKKVSRLPSVRIIRCSMALMYDKDKTFCNPLEVVVPFGRNDKIIPISTSLSESHQPLGTSSFSSSSLSFQSLLKAAGSRS